MAIQEKKKVTMNGHYVAFVNMDLYLAFERKVSTPLLIAWVKEKAKERFGIKLKSHKDISLLREAVVEQYYDDIGDWIQEEMRKIVNNN